ncbi:unnamed protein product [Musa hybrid cultivar]
MWGESECHNGLVILTWVQSSVIVLDGVLTGSPWLETPQATELIALNESIRGLITIWWISECHNCSLVYSLTSSNFPLRTVIKICKGMNNKPRRLHMGVGPCNCLERNPQHKGCISFTSSESRKASSSHKSRVQLLCRPEEL